MSKLTFVKDIFVWEGGYETKEIPKDALFRWDAYNRHWWTDKPYNALKLIKYADAKTKKKLENYQQQKQDTIEASRALSADIDIPVPEGLELLPFQKAGVAYLISRPNILLADEMGVGKSIMSLTAINYITNIKKVLIICPATPKINWKREAEKWLTRDFTIGISMPNEYVEGVDINIINYDILSKFRERMLQEKWDLLILDECLPYDAKVVTDCGIMSIGYIVENELPVSVLSFNFSSNVLEYKRIKAYSKNKLLGTFVEVNFKGGRIVCTGNHKLWTEEEGYIEARKIQNYHHLRLLQTREDNAEKGEKHCEILFPQMCGNGKPHKGRYKRKNTPSVIETSNSKKVRMVWRNFFFSFKGSKTQFKKILWEVVFGQMENVFPLSKACFSMGSQNCPSESKGTKTSLDFRKDEIKQSNEKSCYCRKNETEEDRPNFSVKRGERETYCFTDFIGKGIKMANRICYKNSTSKREIPLTAKSLQSRFGQRNVKDSGRSGWHKPQNKEMEIFGQKKGRNIKSVGVESVKILEQRSVGQSSICSSEDTYCYNIEVEDNHNYFANNVLVSNSQYTKSSKAIRSKMVLGWKEKQHSQWITHEGLFNLCTRRWFLSGTPILNRPIEGWTTAHALAPKIFDNMFKYALRYCHAYRDRFGWNMTGASNLEELQDIWRSNFMIRRLKKDVMPELPQRFRSVVPIDSTAFKGVLAKEKEGYDKSKEKLASLRKEMVEAKEGENENKYKEAVTKLRAATLVAFTEMARERHLVALAVAPVVAEHVESAIEEHKVILFAHHLDVIDFFYQKFKDVAVKLTGSETLQQKQKAVDDFQNKPEIKLFVGQTIAAGKAITLTAASHIIFAEQDWVPANISQCEARGHRYGTKENVYIQHFVLDGSIGATMMQRVVTKQNMLDKALDEKERARIEEEPIELPFTESKKIEGKQ